MMDPVGDTQPFAVPSSKTEIEEGRIFAPVFGESGLLPCIVTDAAIGTVLMLAYMNETALRKTLETGEAWYWSRSRAALWHKGATSGQIQRVVEMRVDCDQDALWLKVRIGGDGGCCHTGRASCFYRRIDPVTGQLSFDRDDPSII